MSSDWLQKGGGKTIFVSNSCFVWATPLAFHTKWTKAVTLPFDAANDSQDNTPHETRISSCCERATMFDTKWVTAAMFYLLMLPEHKSWTFWVYKWTNIPWWMGKGHMWVQAPFLLWHEILQANSGQKEQWAAASQEVFRRRGQRQVAMELKLLWWWQRQKLSRVTEYLLSAIPGREVWLTGLCSARSRRPYGARPLDGVGRNGFGKNPTVRVSQGAAWRREQQVCPVVAKEPSEDNRLYISKRTFCCGPYFVTVAPLSLQIVRPVAQIDFCASSCATKRMRETVVQNRFLVCGWNVWVWKETQSPHIRNRNGQVTSSRVSTCILWVCGGVRGPELAFTRFDQTTYTLLCTIYHEKKPETWKLYWLKQNGNFCVAERITVFGN